MSIIFFNTAFSMSLDSPHRPATYHDVTLQIAACTKVIDPQKVWYVFSRSLDVPVSFPKSLWTIIRCRTCATLLCYVRMPRACAMILCHPAMPRSYITLSNWQTNSGLRISRVSITLSHLNKNIFVHCVILYEVSEWMNVS